MVNIYITGLPKNPEFEKIWKKRPLKTWNYEQKSLNIYLKKDKIPIIIQICLTRHNAYFCESLRKFAVNYYSAETVVTKLKTIFLYYKYIHKYIHTQTSNILRA